MRAFVVRLRCERIPNRRDRCNNCIASVRFRFARTFDTDNHRGDLDHGSRFARQIALARIEAKRPKEQNRKINEFPNRAGHLCNYTAKRL